MKIYTKFSYFPMSTTKLHIQNQTRYNAYYIMMMQFVTIGLPELTSPVSCEQEQSLLCVGKVISYSTFSRQHKHKYVGYVCLYSLYILNMR